MICYPCEDCPSKWPTHEFSVTIRLTHGQTSIAITCDRGAYHSLRYFWELPLTYMMRWCFLHLSGSYRHTAEKIDVTADGSLLPPRCQGHLVNCASYSPDGRFVLAAFLDCAARIWSLHKGERIHILIPSINLDDLGGCFVRLMKACFFGEVIIFACVDL